MAANKLTFIEKHYMFGVSEFEGLWQMTFMDPFNKEAHMSVLVVAPNSDYNADDHKDKIIVSAGPRLTEVMQKLLYGIQFYPYEWDFTGKKIVSFGYDFETDYNGTALTTIDLTEIAFKEVNEYYNFSSPLQQEVIEDTDIITGKGVMSKVRIVLDKPKYVNRLEIDFFTEYPIELVSFMYREDANTDVFYEIPILKAVTTNHSVYLHFPNVYAKVFYIVIKQESYILLNGTNQPSAVDGELRNAIINSYYNTNPTPVALQDTAMNDYREDFSQAKMELDKQQR